MNYLDYQDTLLMELAREFGTRGQWFGEPAAQAYVYLFQELLAIDLGFEFYWYSLAPRSEHLEDCLEYARGKGWLTWKTWPGYPRAAYHCTELGLKFRDPAFIETHGGPLTRLLDSVPPGHAYQLARVQFLLKAFGEEEGRVRLDQVHRQGVVGWDAALDLLEKVRCGPPKVAVC